MSSLTMRIGAQPPAAQKLLYSLPDPVARNDPATRKCKAEIGFLVSDYSGLEAYIRGVNRLLNPNVSPAQFEQWWKSIYNGYRALDNGNGYDSGHWRLFNLYMAGGTYRPVSDVIDNGWREVYAMDPANPPPVPTNLWEINMTTQYFLTISRTQGNEPWQQFAGRFVHPFLGIGGRNWVRMGEYDGRGGMRSATKIEHPFIPAKPAITLGVIGV